MRRLAFVVVIVGMFVLLLLLNLEPETVESLEDLEGLEINTRVVVSGEVVSERVLYLGKRLLVLENGIELVCSCSGGFIGREVFVEGVVSEYGGKKQVEVLEIKKNKK